MTKDEAYGARAIGKMHGCVTVRFEGDRLILQSGSISVVKSDVILCVLPERIKVFDEDGTEIRRDRHLRRLISVESFNPYHLLLDVREELWP